MAVAVAAIVVQMCVTGVAPCTPPAAPASPVPKRVFAHYLVWYTSLCHYESRPREGWCGPGNYSDTNNYQYVRKCDGVRVCT